MSRTRLTAGVLVPMLLVVAALAGTAAAACWFEDCFCNATAAGDPEWKEVQGEWRGGAGWYWSDRTRARNLSVVRRFSHAWRDPVGTVILARLRVSRTAPGRLANFSLVFNYRDAAHYDRVKFTQVRAGVVRVQLLQVGDFDGRRAGKFGTGYLPGTLGVTGTYTARVRYEAARRRTEVLAGDGAGRDVRLFLPGRCGAGGAGLRADSATLRADFFEVCPDA